MPFWVTTVHTVADWFLYRYKNRFSLVRTYPQTVAAFAYVINETPLFCGSIIDRTTWHRAANCPIFLTFLPPWFHLEPANWQMLRQPTSGKEMVITSSTATFLRRRRWGEEPANLWVDGLNLCCRARGLPCLCPILFFYFFSFFASKRIITFFQNMSFNDLSSRIFFRTLSSFNGIFPSIFTSLLF